MSVLRRSQIALKLLSTALNNSGRLNIIQTANRKPPPYLISSYRYYSAKPNEEKNEQKSQEGEGDGGADMDPFGLGDVMDSSEKSARLVQGFYPESERQEEDQKSSPIRQAPPPPQSRSRSAGPEEVADQKRQTRLAEYDSWLRRRDEIDVSQRSEIGEAETFRETHFGRVRIDSDNPSYGPTSEFRQRQRSASEVRRGRGRGFKLMQGEDREVARDRERLKEMESPDELADEDVVEEVSPKKSIRMRASDFLKELKHREGIRDDDGETDREQSKGKFMIQRIVKPRKVDTPTTEDVDKLNFETFKEDPSLLDKPVVPKEYLLPDYNAMTEQDMWAVLRKCVVFQNDFIFAINKPSGVPMHSKSRNCRHVLIQFMDKFAELAKCEKLHHIHRLDKETTGVLLFAKNGKVASVIKEKFKTRQVNKVYLAATKLCPMHPEGTINIPIGEGLIPGTKDKYRRVLRPDLREYGIRPSTRSCAEAITEYRVLHSIKEAAFLEIKPITGIKHQIRVHLGMGLGCPVIADHKYSHRDKMAPQRLHPFILHRMKVRQSKVREMPLHLHCNSISFTLPKEFTNSTEPVYIHANIPIHMKYTLRRLGLIGR